MKNITVLIGSPRKHGNTDLLAQSFIEGAKQSDNAVDVIYAAECNVNGCLGCNCCYTEGHKCVLNDEMQTLYGRLQKADVIVIATPVYFYGVSSQLKRIIDRCHNPIRNEFNVKKLALLSVSADTIPTVFDSIITMYKSTLRYFSLEDGGIVTASGVIDKGDIKNNPALERARQLGENI